MRTLSLLVFSAILAWSQAHQPPEPPPVTKANGAETAQTKEATGKYQRPPANESATLEKIGEANPHEPNTKANTEEVEINRHLATFTGLLVLVGILQIAALVAQAAIFWQPLKENRGLIQASQRAADAA